MKLIVVSPEQSIEDEIKVVYDLLDSGLQYFHLRKPSATKDDLRRYLDKINPIYRNRVSIHSHHELADDYDLERIHIPESTRMTMSTDKLEELKDSYIVSTSFHDENEAMELGKNYSYYFLGPIFDSISKKGYAAKKFDIIHQLSGSPIAIGGVRLENMNDIREMGFKGAAFLGSLWKSQEESLNYFNKIKEHGEGICS